ncbi:hypothetical protein BB559_004369 [Furculomyces boomerangus]|uniref:Uncharacterized protein n=1 Tax=Furculomyces boomerangus TaxID=61424 RepID=A0A2T9YF69_9FUNG|nr:hypothetical protein BB559_004369 [Furculomyces boomerangus]
MFQPTEKNTDIDDKDTNTGNQTSLIPEPESSASTNNNTAGVTPNIPRTRPRYAKLDLKKLHSACAICGNILKTEEQDRYPGHNGSFYCYDCCGLVCECSPGFLHYRGSREEYCRCGVRCLHFASDHGRGGGALNRVPRRTRTIE